MELKNKLADNELEYIEGGAYTGAVYRYTIKPGDCLSEIAAKNGTTVSILMALNQDIKDPNLIYAGKILYIPYLG